MKKKILHVSMIAVGFMLVGAAVFAKEIGIDNNAEWGSKRIVLFIAGLAIFLLGISFPYLGKLSDKYRVNERIRNNHDIAFAIRLSREYWWFVLPVVLVVLFIYIWFASAGLWTTWPERREYYSLLAQAFQNRQLYLDIEPSEKLLSLPNPYNPSQRAGTGEPLDFSLYQGKFYLYWGPVPGLILAALGLAISTILPDVYLTFGFSFGLFLLLTMLVVFIWDRYFSDLPNWILVMSVLLVGLAAPLVWVLCTGEIYEAAIVGGQFFLFAGFLTALSSLDESPPSGIKLIITGLLWALAIGTRLTLIIPIGFMMLMVAYMLWRRYSSSLGTFFMKLILLGLPVLLGFASLAWYNWARFGSVTETGFTYQLAGTYIQENLDQVISHRYVVQNFYNYLLAPFQLMGQFPFIHTNSGSIKSVLPFIQLPGFYNTNPITGLVFVLPFVFFSVFNLIGRKGSNVSPVLWDDKNLPLGWIVCTLSGTALIAFVFLLVFFWAAMRYVLDFSTMLLVVSIIGYIRGYRFAKEKGLERHMAAIGIFVAALSIFMSIVLSISGNIVMFQQANPELLEWFARLGE